MRRSPVAVTRRAERMASEVWPRRPEKMVRPPLTARWGGELALCYGIGGESAGRRTLRNSTDCVRRAKWRAQARLK